MKHSFDDYGWYAGPVDDGQRTTAIDPQHTASRAVGAPYPNFTGVEWVLVTYAEPPIPDPKPAQRAAIIARLAAIDKETDKPRTRREVALGNLTYLQTLDDQAAALRAQLAAI